jgi:hypothetical protein
MWLICTRSINSRYFRGRNNLGRFKLAGRLYRNLRMLSSGKLLVHQVVKQKFSYSLKDRPALSSGPEGTANEKPGRNRWQTKLCCSVSLRQPYHRLISWLTSSYLKLVLFFSSYCKDVWCYVRLVLKMQAPFSSETVVATYQTTRHHRDGHSMSLHHSEITLLGGVWLCD